MGKPHKKSQPKKEAFLAAYAQLGNVSAAAIAAKCSRRDHYRWLKDDTGYKARFDDAHKEACENLEAEARRRAVEGVEEPVFHKGQVCGTIRKYSDTLLIFLLKGAVPEKYRERFEHSGPGGGAIVIEEREDWYGNNAHGIPAKTPGASDARLALPVEIQAGGVRKAVGENGNGAASHN